MKGLKFYLTGLLIAGIMAVVGFPAVGRIGSLDAATFYTALAVALLCMVISQLAREWGARAGQQRLLAGVGLGMFAKLAVFVSSYLLVSLATDLPAGAYLVTLTVFYFVLYLYEMVSVVLAWRPAKAEA